MPVGINPIKENPRTASWPSLNHNVESLRKVAELTNQSSIMKIEEQLSTTNNDEQKSPFL